jgi:hypothetical protein
MVYHNKMVAVVKCGGQILREVSDADGKVVYLPFGSEFSILLKNMHTRKALVKIFIDGQDVSPSSGYVIDANTNCELERFYSSHNRFKFIQKTQEIVQHRGDKIDDGMIRVEFQFEKPKPVNVDVNYNYTYRYHYCSGCPLYHPFKTCWYCPYNSPRRYTEYLNNDLTFTTSDNMRGISAGLNAPSSSVNYTATVPEVKQDEGITVQGSYSGQEFRSAYIGELEPNKEVIVIRLRGRVGEAQPVAEPVTVKTKTTCPTCGRTWDAGTKFCANCGTHLAIY